MSEVWYMILINVKAKSHTIYIVIKHNGREKCNCTWNCPSRNICFVFIFYHLYIIAFQIVFKLFIAIII